MNPHYTEIGEESTGIMFDKKFKAVLVLCKAAEQNEIAHEDLQILMRFTILNTDHISSSPASCAN